jgi:hypothetical protein
MKAKKIILAAFAGTALLAAAGAQARDHWRDGHRGDGHYRHGHYNHGHHGHGHRHYAPRVVVRPAYRPYYRPAPVYYAPPPYYYAPAPAIYGRIPLGHHSSIGFSLPLGY